MSRLGKSSSQLEIEFSVFSVATAVHLFSIFW